MITVPAGAQIWIAAGATDLRQGFTGLGAAVQMRLEQDPFCGHAFVFRGRRSAGEEGRHGGSEETDGEASRVKAHQSTGQIAAKGVSLTMATAGAP